MHRPGMGQRRRYIGYYHKQFATGNDTGNCELIYGDFSTETNHPQIIIWDMNTRQKQIVDTGLRDSLSCVLWAKSTQILAVASTRGNLAIYNHRTTRSVSPSISPSNSFIFGCIFCYFSFNGSDERRFSVNIRSVLRAVPGPRIIYWRLDVKIKRFR